MNSANQKQVGGTHYAGTTQHWDMVLSALDNRYLEGNATKYLARWRKKNGVQDLEKAEHYLEKLIEAAQLMPLFVRPVPADKDQTALQDFIRDAGDDITTEEAYMIARIAGWRCVEELQAVLGTLRTMIAVERATAKRVTRPSRDEWGLGLASVVATRGTCLRRQVGCVLVNARGHIIASGYNGKAAGLTHCYDEPCEGANAPSGTGLDSCEAIHAEQNALMQCKDIHDIHTCYTTASPCITCVKLLLNTACKRIVFKEEYPHGAAKHLWLADERRVWLKL